MRASMNVQNAALEYERVLTARRGSMRIAGFVAVEAG